MSIRKKPGLMAILFGGMISVMGDCTKKSNSETGDLSKTVVSQWITKGDRSVLLQKQSTVFNFAKPVNSNPVIKVDSSQAYQEVDGFGFTLTGGSAWLIHQLPASQRSELLQELFGKKENSIGVSYLRVSIGASDLSREVFSYADVPEGQTDEDLSGFTLAKDEQDLVPVLKEILAINPAIKIMGSPWSPPVWMKDNGKSIGGSLLPEYYQAYANYFVKYVQAMKAHGITIDAITPQNEPLHPGNNPSLLMLPEQQAAFIRTALGPAFQAAGIQTKIIIYDHNLDRPDYPITVLNDPEAKKYIDGSAFHLYAGEVNTMATVRNAHPDKNLYFTEQWTGAKGDFDGDLYWHTRNVIIGTMRNYSKVALEWNLAADPNYDPHTPGGCTECKGALTINNTAVSRNVAYYIIAHASKFVPAGSKRISSNYLPGLDNVAFLTPEGKKVLIVLNDKPGTSNLNIDFKGQHAPVTIPGGSVATFVW